MKDQPDWLPLPAGYVMSEERRNPPKQPIELRTFKDWSEAGYQILKGSKMVGRNQQGVPLFSTEQVTHTRTPYYGQGEEGDDEFDDNGSQDWPGNPQDYGHS